VVDGKGQTRVTFKSLTLTHLANKLAIESMDGTDAMPSNRYTDNIPDRVEDQKPADDFFASKLAERIRIDNWRKHLTLIRGELLEIAEQGSQQSLVDLTRETMKIVRAIERLETLLGLKATH
jgi:hypothetical protein